MAKVRAWLLWLYNWVSVLTGILVGAIIGVPAIILAILEHFDVYTVLPYLDPQLGVIIMASVAALKGIAAYTQSKMQAKEEEECGQQS